MSKTLKKIFVLLIVASVAFAAMAVMGFMGKEEERAKRLIVEDKLALTLKEKENLEREFAASRSVVKSPVGPKIMSVDGNAVR